MRRRWLWRLLGGAVDEFGEPAPHDDDWIPIFQGTRDDALRVRTRLEALEIPFDVRTIAGMTYGHAAATLPHQVAILVRSCHAAQGVEAVAATPFVRNHLIDPDPLEFSP